MWMTLGVKNFPELYLPGTPLGSQSEDPRNITIYGESDRHCGKNKTLI